MKVLGCVLLIVSLLIATAIVNKVQHGYMRLMGAEVMYFSTKKKLIAICIIAMLIFGGIIKLFGLENAFG